MAYRPIPLIKKATAIAMYMCGDSTEAIRKELQLSYPTVKRIIEESGIQDIAAQTYNRAILLAPKALSVVEHHLDNKSLKAAVEVLHGTNVLRDNQPAVVINQAVLSADEIARARQVVAELKQVQTVSDDLPALAAASDELTDQSPDDDGSVTNSE